jgi:uncharacterized protein (DUF488 family)
MVYRRLILLASFDVFGVSIEKIRLQKLLFLFCHEQKKPAFHFIPYKFGCFSFQVNADLTALKKAGLIDETETNWHIKNPKAERIYLSKEDAILLGNIQRRFSSMSTEELIRYTYLNYPFYAINSTVLSQHLKDSEIDIVHRAIVMESAKTLFTIGYEGKSLEEFINILIKCNVSLLCDVRKNAFSMKYGFSITTLSKACENAKITYLHIPELGIESGQRKSLETKDDYKCLFEQYKKSVLVTSVAKQNELWHLIEKAGRAVLMCFEADPSMCHRTHLAKAILLNNKSPIPLIEL